MPVIAILVGLMTGLGVWAGLDQIQGHVVTKIFDRELGTQLRLRARESLIRFDRYIANYAATTRLLANHRRLAQYLEPRIWLPGEAFEQLIYHDFRPEWLPDIFDRYDLPAPSHILLFDSTGAVREIYQDRDMPLPSELMTQIHRHLVQPDGLKTLFVPVGGVPYLVVGDLIEDLRGFPMGSLVLTVPIDGDFLAASQQGVWIERAAVALVGGDTQRIIASIDAQIIAPGTQLDAWRDDYLITSEPLPQQEDTHWPLHFATFISHASVDRMSRHVRNFDWRQRAIAAVVFIAVFTLVIYLVSVRLSKVLQRMTRFAHRALNIAQPAFERSGNQLILLEDWIRQFTQLVLKARQELSRYYEHEMRETEALKAAIMEASLDSIVTIDGRGLIVELNPTAKDVLGLRREQDIGQLFAERASLATDRSQLDTLLAESRAAQLEGREPHVHGELIARRHDGSAMPVELSIVPIAMDDEALYTLYMHDISAVRRAEQASRQHQAELVHVCRLSTLGEVATGMAHELNQPLSAIVNFANGASRRLRAEQIDREALIRAMGQITSQAERASEIIRRLRVLVAKQPPSRVTTDLNHLVREVCSFVEYDAERLGLAIALDLAPRPIPVHVDLVQIEQVLLNLVRNALDALETMPCAARRLHIRTTTKANDAEVRIEDNGPGIEPAQMGQLFDPFYSTKATGMGMGLTISKTIIDDHQGQIWAESTPGESTQFYVVLLLATPIGQSASSEDPS